MGKSVIIIGGGIAGLASAVFLSRNGFDAKIFESAPKWGGRTYSYYDIGKKKYIDNGQHILAGWYYNTFEYLKIIGTYEKLILNDTLELTFSNPQKEIHNFKCGKLPGVYGLLTGIFRFNAFNLGDKLKFLKIRKVLNEKKYKEDYLISVNAETLLNELEQTDNLKKYFWYPLILASFNTVPENVCADLFVKLLKKGTELKKNMSIILSDVNLNELFINRAVEYLFNNNVGMFLSSSVKKINIEGNIVKSIETENGNTVYSDYYICTVPFYNYEKLFEKNIFSQYFCNTGKLKSSSIVSVHLFLDRDLNFPFKVKMLGLIDSVAQWIFVKDKKHLCIVISASDYIENNLTEKNSEEIFKICLKDLSKCLDKFDSKNVIDYKVVKEKRATFLPEVGSEKFRLNQETNIDNLFIGGDWTCTGYPATIEGAIKSAKICSDLMMKKVKL